jgi:hypothetical protein
MLYYFILVVELNKKLGDEGVCMVQWTQQIAIVLQFTLQAKIEWLEILLKNF